MKFNVFMERLQTFFYIFVTFYVLAFLNFNVNDVTDDISYLM